MTQTKCDPESRPPKGDRIPGEENCSSWVAYPYFVSFVIVCSFLVKRFIFYGLKNRPSYMNKIFFILDSQLVCCRHNG